MFYETLKEVCDKKKTSPSAVCVALGISKSNVTNWKKGRYPSFDTAIKIANYLHVNLLKLVPKETDCEKQEGG